MNILIPFLLGIVFIQWVFPLIDGIINLILSQLEVWKSYMALKIAKNTAETTKIAEIEEESGSSVNAIGFVIPQEEEEEYDD